MVEDKYKAIEEANEKMSALRLKHATELQMLRDEVQKADLKLIEERNVRKSLEEKMGSMSSEHSSKVRDIEDLAETRLRESVRKARLETEEEYREKIRVIERKAQDELESSRVDMTVLKRKLDEAIRDVDHVKRKSVLSKSDGKLEAQAEIDALKLSLVEQEEQDRKQASELRKLREDNASIQGRLAGLIQSLQVAQAESDSLRASNLKAVRDDQEHNGAYQQAMQRILTLDSEVAKYKAECFVLRKDREEQALELRKLQSNASFTGDRLSITESEARRLKSQLHVRAILLLHSYLL